MRNRFTNPANGAIYDWHRNHDPDGEEDAGKARNVIRVPNTSGTGVMLQQGDDGAYVIKLRGRIVQRAQWQSFWAWFEISRRQTIYFRDFDGQEYEVQMTSLSGSRRGNLRRPQHDPQQHVWTYSMELTVITFRVGDMVGVTA